MKKWSILISAGFVLFLGTGLQAESVYKWKDTEGKVIYSQTPPPPGISYVIVEQRSNQSVHLQPTAKKDVASIGESTTSDTENESEKSQQELIAESKKIKQENCAQVKQNLQSLTSRGQVTIKDGELYRKLTEEERQAKISENEKLKDEFCN